MDNKSSGVALILLATYIGFVAMLPANAQDSPPEPETKISSKCWFLPSSKQWQILGGIDTLVIKVSVPENLKQLGVSEEGIRTSMINRLVKERIKTSGVDSNKAEPNTLPYLSFQITGSEADGLVTCHESLEVIESVSITRTNNPMIHKDATTWGTSGESTVAPDKLQGAAEKALQEQLDIFIRDYLRANPPGQTSLAASKQDSFTASASPVPAARTLPDKIAVLAFAGPLEKRVEYATVPGYVNRKGTDFPDIAEILQEKLTQSLAKTRNDQVIPLDLAISAMHKAHFDPTATMSADDWKRMSNAVQAKYIVSGDIVRLVFKERLVTGNDFIISASAKVIDGSTGQIIARIPPVKVKKHPWLTSQFGYNAYWSKTVMPELAKILANRVLKVTK